MRLSYQLKVLDVQHQVKDCRRAEQLYFGYHFLTIPEYAVAIF
jgi:hypothetical protein